MKTYAGIGSRETPENLLDIMIHIGATLAKAGWLLRSGAANGADTAFESGCDQSRGAKEIFLPWRYYNQSRSPYYQPSDKAFDIAAEFHPAWSKLSDSVMKLHARNVHIMLGEHCDTPVDMVICWTPEGRVQGGTGQALRMADGYNIPVFNLALDKNWQLLEQFVEKQK